MKKSLLLLFAFATLSSMAQTNVYLKINHMLGNQAFALSQAASNNLGNDFNVTRLEYYISNIILVHDGGMQTPATDVYILANASDSTYEMLGSYNITTLEAIRFGIGVDPSHNNLDPSSYPASHPLAPKSPSMHWGWAAGYRFVAMEGRSGTNLVQFYELHALDNSNYFMQTIPTAGIANGGNLVVSLDADYEMALKNIDVSSGTIIHGAGGVAITFLQNFAWSVFKSSEGNSAMGNEELLNTQAITVSPNPSRGASYITLNNLPENAEVSMFDITGKRIKATVNNGTLNVSKLNQGIYILQVTKSGKAVHTGKVVVTQ